MNERIQKLAKEANCSIDGMGYGEGNLENFAELIIRECADILLNINVDGYERLLLSASAKEFKKHFGVE